jgi:threonine/homoserine/homoserine lactone efflux protein
VTTVLLQSLLLASSGLLSVGSITLVILLLISDRGWRNGLGYALGYFSAYTTIGTLVVVLGYRAAENSTREPSPFFPILLLFYGSLLLWMAFRNWRKPTDEKQDEPRFFSIVDKMTPLKSFGFGALVSVINFKNLALFLTALSVVIVSELPIAQKSPSPYSLPSSSASPSSSPLAFTSSSLKAQKKRSAASRIF